MPRITHNAVKLGITFLWLLLLVSVIGLTAPQGRSITVTVNGLTVMYQLETTWDKGGFTDQLNSYLRDPTGYLTSLVDSVTHGWSTYTVSADQWQVELCASYTAATKKMTWSTVLRGQVHGAVSATNGRYLARFQWLLLPLGLDFIDSHFTARKDGLFWGGEIAGIPTTITVKVPPRSVPYTAWHEPNGHCHAHVWWEQ